MPKHGWKLLGNNKGTLTQVYPQAILCMVTKYNKANDLEAINHDKPAM